MFVCFTESEIDEQQILRKLSSVKQKEVKEQSLEQFDFRKSGNKKAIHIIEKCLEQNKHFKRWQQKKRWSTFHHQHYDWWAFPVDQRSSYGETYMVENKQIQVMKKSKQFMQALSTNAQMVCEAWGWNLLEGKFIKTSHQDQTWHNWPIRLYKMTRSLEIFGLEKQFQNAVKYGNQLIKLKKNFTYNRRDLSEYFLAKNEIMLGQKEQKEQVMNKNFYEEMKPYTEQKIQ